MNTFTRTQRSEVDIRVAQELKNHQDFVYETNQKLQSLEQTIASLRKDNEQLKSRFDSAGKDFAILVENLQSIVQAQYVKTKKALDAFEFVMNAHEALINEHIVQADKKYCTIHALNEVHAQLYIDYAEEAYQLNKLDRFVQESIKLLQISAKAGLDGLRKELTPVIPDVDPLEKKVNQILSEWKVDQDGLKKEIAILKHASHYADKKFENIYTTLEKMKKGGI